MARITKVRSKPRRIAAVIGALAFAGALSGCVVAPAPGYYGYYGYYHHPVYHPYYWRGGWHDHDDD